MGDWVAVLIGLFVADLLLVGVVSRALLITPLKKSAFGIFGAGLLSSIAVCILQYQGGRSYDALVAIPAFLPWLAFDLWRFGRKKPA